MHFDEDSFHYTYTYIAYHQNSKYVFSLLNFAFFFFFPNEENLGLLLNIRFFNIYFISEHLRCCHFPHMRYQCLYAQYPHGICFDLPRDHCNVTFSDQMTVLIIQPQDEHNVVYLYVRIHIRNNTEETTTQKVPTMQAQQTPTLEFYFQSLVRELIYLTSNICTVWFST